MNIAVIGAGPAGLAFADRIKKLDNSVSIDIYEKSNYIGGISKTVNIKIIELILVDIDFSQNLMKS